MELDSLEDVFLQEDVGPTIAEHALQCCHLFKKYMTMPEITLDPTLMDDQLARFTLWTSNMDVFGPPNVSLDYRLRYSPTVVEIIHQLLDVISSSLTSLKQVDDPPQTPSTKKRRISERSNADVTRRADDNSSDSDSDEDQAQKNVSLITYTIGGTVTRLFRLSHAIRKSAKASRASKIGGYRDDEGANNAITELRLYTECYLHFRFPQAPEALRSTLVEANALRLRRLYYQRSHRRRIALSVQRPQADPMRSVQQPKIPERTPAVCFASSVPLKPRAIDESSKLGGLPPAPITYATTAQQTAVRAMFADSVVEVPRAKSVLVNNKLSFPPMPTTSECPYCGVIIEFKGPTKTTMWNDHVIRDLEPFVCLFAPCTDSSQDEAGLLTFETSKAWLSHIQNAHGYAWECRAPSHDPIIFEQEIEFQEHSRREHDVPDVHVGTLSGAARRPVLEKIRECPFGDDFSAPENAESNTIFANEALYLHVAAHMKEITLLVLQKLPSDDDDESEDVASDAPLENDGFVKLRGSMYSLLDDEALGFQDGAEDRLSNMLEEGVSSSVDRLDLEDKDATIIHAGSIYTNQRSWKTIKMNYWYVPRPVNTLFTGRVDIINRIKSAITLKEGSRTQRRFVITGIGGIGKSEICLKIADEMREAFWGIFWVDVDSESAAADDFIKIANILKSATETIDGARQSLSNEECDWLLILDNANDPEFDYKRYFPSGSRGAILLISRNNRTHQLSTVGSESLGSLEPTDCLNLFFQAAEIEPSDKYKEPAMRIVNLLNSHTLALIQAGAYIAQDFCSVEEYPTVYEMVAKQLLNLGLGQALPGYYNVYTTFEVSVQALSSSKREDSQDALGILYFLAILHYSNVPLELFKDAWSGAQRARKVPEDDTNIDTLLSWHASQLPQVIQWCENTWNTFRLRRAQNLLQSLALIQKKEERGILTTISLHPLVHKWAYIRQADDQRRHSWISAGCMLALSYYGNNRWQPYRLSLQLHLQSLLSKEDEAYVSTSSMNKFRLLFQCCELMDQLRMDLLVSRLLTTLLNGLQLDPTEPREKFLPLYILAARNLYSVGNINRTIELQEKIMYINKKLAEDHPDRLASQYELARAYQANSQTKEATQLLEHIVKIHKTTLAEDHPNRLASQHSLARVYQANGQTKEAIQLLEHIVKVQETTLAESHPDRLASQYALAEAYRANGQIKEAVQLLKHVVKVQKILLAEDHPSRLVSLHSLAMAYQADSQIKEAIQLLEYIIKVQTTLAEDHPNRLASQHSLARAYQANGQIKEAIQLLEHVVKVQITLAEDHPGRLVSQYELAGAYEANGQIKEAIRLLEHVVKVHKTTLAEDHPNRLASQHSLARVYQANSQIKEAIQLLEHVVRVQKATLAEDHPDQLASQYLLAGAYEANSQIKEAIQLLEHVVKVHKTILAEDHPNRLASQHSLARVYQANSQIKEAIQLLEHIVRVQKATLAEDHPGRLVSQYELAGAYEANSQIKEAIRLLEHVVKVHKTTLAEDHPNRLASQHSLARVYQANGQIKEAIQLLEHVVRVQKATLAEDHPDQLASQYLLAGAYEANSQIKEAIQLLEHDVKVHKPTLAEGHPDRLALQHALARVKQTDI